ncbi:uncharacterized protein DUF4181 [Planomicrobium soli]|uniref:Uncharacterized protein DUF4181 n=1 Tax=Planomicrobium soli TaxID=1176648 RepID=A0A2P8GQP7_9BACL|nr:DUF4181 domain-containing protein [Planomicrobium soli]PSL36299.1 uncharacterized protein DUF4181 [Planomicrobium soli]
MFWLKAGLFLLLLFALISITNFLLRKLFKIEKEKKNFFSYNHINKLHQKVDWVIRIGSMIANLTLLYLVIFKDFEIALYFIGLTLLIILDFAVRAAFEWRSSRNPKQAIITVNEMVFLVIALIAIFQFDLLGF